VLRCGRRGGTIVGFLWRGLTGRTARSPTSAYGRSRTVPPVIPPRCDHSRQRRTYNSGRLAAVSDVMSRKAESYYSACLYDTHSAQTGDNPGIRSKSTGRNSGGCWLAPRCAPGLGCRCRWPGQRVCSRWQGASICQWPSGWRCTGMYRSWGPPWATRRAVPLPASATDQATPS
jgi:hypothetical protein